MNKDNVLGVVVFIVKWVAIGYLVHLGWSLPLISF